MSKRLKELETKFSVHYPRKKHRTLHDLLAKLFERIRKQEATITHLQQFAPPGFTKPTEENRDIDSPLIKWGQGDSEQCYPPPAGQG